MKYTLKILRKLKVNHFFEEFELDYIENSNVISALLQIQKNPINKKNKIVEPISFEKSCLEEVCGACTMLINGFPKQACSTLIKPLIEKNKVITLAPLSKFYCIRDLIVDRTKMFDQLKKMKVWIDTKISTEKFGIKIPPSLRDALYVISKCMTCGCCLEACPQYNEKSKFIGPSIIAQIDLFNSHPSARINKDDRFYNIIKEGGVAECGNAQNCEEVCPKKLSLTRSIANMGKASTNYLLKNLIPFKKKRP